MKKLFCIVGTTGAGKDSLIKSLCQRLNLYSVVSYTTRPMRSNETNGVEHYFVSEDEMARIINEEKVVAYTKIEDSSSGMKGFEYCTTQQELDNSDVYCIDPNGIQYLKTKVPSVEVVSIYIATKYETRKNRVLSASRGSQEEVLKAFEARVANEKVQFDDFLMKEQYDYIVDNNSDDILIAQDTLANIVMNELCSQKRISIREEANLSRALLDIGARNNN